jgi:hypothetical protein
MTAHRPRRLALALVVALLTLAGARPAAAHEGEGVLVVESATPSPTGRDYVVRLTWEDDGHAALDATITATPIDPSGAPGTPVPMAAVDDDGRYQAAVAMPASGQWTVRFTAVTPVALVEVQETVTATTTTTAATATTAASSTTEVTTATTGATGAGTGDEGDDDSGAGLLIGGVAAVAVVAGAAYAVGRSRRSQGAT